MKIDENASNYAINRYLKAWKIPETKTYNLKPLPNSMNKKREIGEIWFEKNKWYKQEEGFKIEFSLKSNIEDTKIFVICHDCGTKFINNTQNTNNIHFVCIDKRVKDSNGKVFIILQNGQKLIMPENVNRVPALLLLNQNYQVLYGESILQHLKPKQESLIKKATLNNLEPISYQHA